MEKWVWDIEGNIIHAENILEGEPCAGEVIFFHSQFTEEEFGMCMSCCEPWKEELSNDR